jgi:hypothetical protein
MNFLSLFWSPQPLSDQNYIKSNYIKPWVVYLGILALSNFYFFTMNGGIDFLKVLTGVFLDFLVPIPLSFLVF